MSFKVTIQETAHQDIERNALWWAEVARTLLRLVIAAIGVLLVWAWVLAMTGFVGLATMTAATALPIYLGFNLDLETEPMFIYTTVMAMCIIFWHRSNIQRMRDGTEHRNTRMMVFRRKGSGSSDDQS